MRKIIFCSIFTIFFLSFLETSSVTLHGPVDPPIGIPNMKKILNTKLPDPGHKSFKITNNSENIATVVIKINLPTGGVVATPECHWKENEGPWQVTKHAGIDSLKILSPKKKNLYKNIQPPITNVEINDFNGKMIAEMESGTTSATR